MSQTPRKPEHADKIEDLGNGYTVERRLRGYAYAVSGNAHNATPRYYWVLKQDAAVITMGSTRKTVVKAMA